jgi:hypothetical protein
MVQIASSYRSTVESRPWAQGRFSESIVEITLNFEIDGSN